ncbi:MAG: uncharacterized protein PWQ76_1161 [Clostridiales bacterium]|jgi:hypothetical protein|nr:ATP-binding protein [Oscillospiraceae bacterium]MDN5378906.1 uncharacterized protein [Clostridiales bacterium]
MKKLLKKRMKIHSLAIFRNIVSDSVVMKLSLLLESETLSEFEKVSRYGDFVSELFKAGGNLSAYLLSLVLEDENVYMLKKARGEQIPEYMQKCLLSELDIIGEIASLKSSEIKEAIGYDGYLPEWETSQIDFAEVYMERIKNISRCGYGIFAKYHAFIFDGKNLLPVKSPDAIKLSQLGGYALERQKLIDNTVALLENKPAANVLLYGDAGTGKSSSVKAVANEFKDRGLRLVEISKKQLKELPALINILGKNPLKFILFIDDLSFSKDDDDFGALKAVLEGSVSSKTPNVAIYATSNRRHLVKESFSDRNGDDIHINDTIEELVSLSARFGLAINFSKPDKELYLEIVSKLAEQYEINMEKEKLFTEAEAFALRKGGRSPRAAKQFVEYLKARG